METHDVGDDLGNFGILERRPAAHPVPGEQQFEHDFRIDLMPQQMSSQRCNARIALTLRHALVNEATPIGKRAPIPATAAARAVGLAA